MARNDYNSNYLAHHGILGQKWGQRNGPPYPLDSESKSAEEKKHGSSSGNGATKEKVKKAKNVLKSNSGSRSSKALKEAREKDIDEMTTQELKETNNRLQEEKRYQDLTKGNIAEGKKFVNEVAKNIATGVIVGVGIEVGKKFVKGMLGI